MHVLLTLKFYIKHSDSKESMKKIQARLSYIDGVYDAGNLEKYSSLYLCYRTTYVHKNSKLQYVLHLKGTYYFQYEVYR